MKSERECFTEGEFYQASFDARTYLNSYYACAEGHSDEKYQLFVLTQLSNTFSTGNLRGNRLIEIGSGPTIHTLLSACHYFEDIVVSDFADRNRREIEMWLNGEDGCFDWDPIIQFVCELEGKRALDEVKARLRRTVSQVLKCDVRLENPFQPLRVEPADCVLSCLCLEAACKDQVAYRNALQGLGSLLKPGGKLVLIGVINETFYMVGQQRFSCLVLSESAVQGTVRDLGFSIQQFNIMPAQSQKDLNVSDFEAVFYLVAQKPA